MTVKDRVAIVTGSGTGVGAEVARKLASNGAKVIVNDTNLTKVEKIVSEIEATGGVAHGVVADVTKSEEVNKLVETTLNTFYKIDILINNDELYEQNRLEYITAEKWTEMFDINLKSVFLISKAVAEHMKKQQYGRILNISSISALGTPGQSAYSASKGGLVSFTRSLALELAAYQITSNSICPGAMEDELLLNPNNKIMEREINIQPTKRLGKPEDIANGVLFFVADESSYITGQTFYMCGGRSLYSSLSV